MKAKNSLKKMMRLAVIAIAFLLTAGQADAQALCSGYTIDNKTSCTIIVDITFYCNGTACFVQTAQSIGAYSSYSLITPATCIGCTTCDYDVTVTDIGGNTGAPLPITATSANPGPYGWPAWWGCTATYYQVLWTPTRTLIH